MQDHVNSLKVWLFEHSSEWFIHAGIGLVSGFILGFLVKHFIKYLFMLVVSVGLILYLGEYYNIIIINYPAVNLVMASWPLLLHWVRFLLYEYSAYIFVGMVSFIFALLFS